MGQSFGRRDWLKQTTLASLGLGLSLRSLAGEDYLPKYIDNNEIINLGANENPYGLSPKALQAIKEMLPYNNRYQVNVSSLKNFKTELASQFQLAPENILLTAGSGEGLVLLARHFNSGNIVCPKPTFGILQNTARKIGTEVIEINLTPDKAHDLPRMLNAINSNTSLVYVVNPNNPTGTIVSSAALKDFCKEASKKAAVLVDEAYIDFVEGSDKESMFSLIESNPNIIVMRTFSKIHGMAGMRIGFIAAHPTLIKKLEQNTFSNTQYCVSNLAMTAALASIKDEAYQTKTKQLNKAARQYAFDELKKMNYPCIPSHTNFLFFKLNNYEGNFATDMLKKNVIVRSNRYEDGQWCRLSIGTLKEMQSFIQILKQTS